MASPLTVPSPGLAPVTRVLVLAVAAIGFLFDTYELLMFPVIGADSLSELLKQPPSSVEVRNWTGRMLWIAALCGGAFGLLGGFLIDRLGRKRVMIASILLYSLSPVAASFSTELWHLVLFRCTTFIGVCVEMVAAVTWLAELFDDKRTRELVIGWTLACASLGGIFVTEVYSEIVSAAKTPGALPHIQFPEGHDPNNVAWRYTLLTGLVPGALILILLPFVPESRVWAQRKAAGTLRRPNFGELFSPELRRTTIVTSLLSACAYAAAFGALQLTPPQIVPGLPDISEKRTPIEENKTKLKDREAMLKEAMSKGQSEESNKAGKAMVDNLKKEIAGQEKEFNQELKARRGNIQRWQELGGLTGRILFAVLLIFLPSRMLLRIFLIPGVLLFPLTYLELVKGEYALFATAIFFCGLLTVAQMSYMSEFLPRVFPVHLRGTGGAFATNVGARMIGTMAATFNTEILSGFFTPSGPTPVQVATGVATAAAIIGATVYLIAFAASFLLPTPKEEPITPAPIGPEAG